MSNQNRVSAGVPSGGQFAQSTRGEAGVALTTPVGPVVGETIGWRETRVGDYIVVDGRLHSVEDISTIDVDSVEVTTMCGEEEHLLPFSGDDVVSRVDDSARHLRADEPRALFPDRIFEDDFEDQYGTIDDPESGSNSFETPPAGTPEERVWSQVEGFTADGRYDYTVVPGHVSDAINYVVTEKPWTDADQTKTFDWN